MSSDRSERTALDRYLAIAEAVGPDLDPAARRELLKERAVYVRELADGNGREYSVATLRRWLRLYQERGLDGLRPQVRRDRGSVRAHPDLIEEACRLRQELPARSANQISRIIELRNGVRVPARSIRRHLRGRGLDRAGLVQPTATVFGRFQAERPNQLWIADFLDGPSLPFGSKPNRRRPTHLFLILDDYSRLIVHARWVLREDARTAQLVFRQGIVARGRPDALYCDGGSAFISTTLVRTCAVLRLRLIHSRPYRPQGRGKQERNLGTVRRQFLIEAEHERIQTLAQLNDAWAAWAERAYHRQIHSETGEAPLARYLAQAPASDIDAELLFEAFRWASSRKVNSKTALVPFQGNHYKAPDVLAGRRVELRYEPEDLTRIEVWYEQRSYGLALPLRISRHVHPQLIAPALPATASPNELSEPAKPGYLAELQARYERENFSDIDYRPAIQKEQL